MSFDLIVCSAHVATATDLFYGDIGIAGGVDAHCHLDQPMWPPARLADGFETGTRWPACDGTTTVNPFAAQTKGQSAHAAYDDDHRCGDGQANVDCTSHPIVSDPMPTVPHQEPSALIEPGCT